MKSKSTYFSFFQVKIALSHPLGEKQISFENSLDWTSSGQVTLLIFIFAKRCQPSDILLIPICPFHS